MKIGVLKETYPGEQRVALVPSVLPSLIKEGMEVLIESKAGDQSDRKSTRLNSSHTDISRMPSSA